MSAGDLPSGYTRIESIFKFVSSGGGDDCLTAFSTGVLSVLQAITQQDNKTNTSAVAQKEVLV